MPANVRFYFLVLAGILAAGLVLMEVVNQDVGLRFIITIPFGCMMGYAIAKMEENREANQ
jgi:hypothetical protein